MINILLNASITGGIVILLWRLSYPLSKKYFKASWHYAVLKITMIFMLIPISLLAPMFSSVFAGLFSKAELPYISEQIQRISIDAETISSVNSAVSDFVFPEVQHSPPLPQQENEIEKSDSINNYKDNTAEDLKTTLPNIPYLQIIWLIIAAILFSGGIDKMHRFKKQIIRSSSGNADRETQELFLQCREQLRLRGGITLRTSEYIKTPLVFGLARPFVILPETDMSADEKRLALTHELTHIKNGDLWIKFIAFIISSVHWFNPFAHLLRRKIFVISEEYCDERVVKTMTKEERLLYGILILKTVSDIAAPQFCSTLSVPTKNLQRRLFNMINTKKSRKGMIALSVIAALIICSFATVYALAANTGETGNFPSNLPEIVNVYAGEDINAAVIKKPDVIGTLGIGYTGGDGEATSRISRDGGVTWYITDDDFHYTLDPDISAIKWLTCDEFEAWIEERRAKLTDEQIEDYEAELEDLKNGIANSAGKVSIGNVDFECVFVFYCAESSGNTSSSYLHFDGEKFQTYSWGEMDAILAENQFHMNKIQPSQEEIDAIIVDFKSSMESQPSQEELETIIAQYESAMGDDNIQSFNIDGFDCKILTNDYSGIMQSFVSSYQYSTSCNGDNYGFAADTYKELYETVKKYFEKLIAEDKMTQEEADVRLAEVTEENTFKYIEGTGDINDYANK